MQRSFVLILIGIFGSIKAEDESSSCSLQFDSKVKCILDLIGSSDAKLVENKTKDVFHTKCAPDYPLDCFSEFDAAKQCYVDTKILIDVPGPLKTQKDAANAAAESCFTKKSNAGFLSGLEDIFFPSPIKVLSGGLAKALWGSEKGPLAPPPIAAAILKGISATSPAPDVSGEGSKENDTDDGGYDDQRKLFGRPECAPKRDQFLCTFKELVKLEIGDTEFKRAIDTLKKGAESCKKSLQERCTPSSPEESRCVTEAHIPLILAFVDHILSCMKQKGFTLPPMPGKMKQLFSPPPRILPLLGNP